MNKVIIGSIVAVIVIVGGVAAFMLLGQPNSESSNTSESNSTISKIDACDVLTEKVAKEILGENIAQPDGSIGDISTPDQSVSNCQYITNAPASSTSSIPKASGVSLLARVANTEAGSKDNKEQFANMPEDIEFIEGYGDKAFYNPAFRQLNVLKGGNWYVITYFIDSITNADLESNKKLADKLNFQ